ncbi:MAG: aminotransferase class V-fold PLP-dependent enzyme [Acidobacteria bacterium]|nr:aminotransferase class V-fold PLP-dependent enzyme [Acidobacteriota bacterium]
MQTTRWTLRVPGTQPSLTEQFEEKWAAISGSQFALAVTSGSTAIELALRGLEIKPGDEVIVPALGWYATAAAVSRVGAKPVFADVDLRTTCLDPIEVEKCITPRTVAIIAVHLHSAIADMAKLAEIASRHSLLLIEDAAQAHGGRFYNQPVGSIGRIGCFSFNQEKLVAAGEGGAVVTNDKELFQRMYTMRTDGYTHSSPSNDVFFSDGRYRGNNQCLSELHAILLLEQSFFLSEETQLREKNAAMLDQALAIIAGIEPLTSTLGTTIRPFYEYGFICLPNAFGDWSLRIVAQILSKETGIDFHETDLPVEICPQFAPECAAKAPPRALQVYQHLLVFHHRYLLSAIVADVVPLAIQKVLAIAREIPSAYLSA